MIQIISLTQKKTNVYKIAFNNNTAVSLYDETIIKFSLTKGKEINEKFLIDIKKYDNNMNLYFKTRNLLLKKKQTKKEIVKKLKQDIDDQSDIEEIIWKLEKLNLINDKEYMKSYINDQVNLTLHGPDKIKAELVYKGFQVNEIEELLEIYTEDFWLKKINKIIEKKIKSNRKESNKMFKQKTKSYIYNMGYNFHYNIRDIENEFDILKDLYNKLKIKYEKNNKDIKNELLKKGFELENINKFKL
ncbi:MAG: RecX family transcriptional regulator [bacterium]